MKPQVHDTHANGLRNSQPNQMQTDTTGKKKSRIIFSLLLAGLVGSGGCITSTMWQKQTHYKTTVHQNSLGKDAVVAFGQASQDSSQIQKGSLVMMGKKYWYVLPPQQSNELLSLLQARLSKPYTIVPIFKRDKGMEGSTLYAENEFPVEILEEKAQFNSNFCLEYATTDQNEINTLLKLGFSRDSSRSSMANNGSINSVYTQCLSTPGQYFATSNSVSAQYYFTTPISVTLYSEELETQRYKEEFGSLGIAKRILLTPGALALDSLGAIIGLPLLMMMDH